ncbi:XRE family transcriptional regulator, partial [Bacillus thuringiensis]|nr:XRE family transcriptional regulator [Bacillus thuringiensis]MED2229408.1 XRE family transcriptional regulator [Bacillus thuringiensis]
IQTVFAGLNESQREQFCKQLLFYTQFLNEKKELL